MKKIHKFRWLNKNHIFFDSGGETPGGNAEPPKTPKEGDEKSYEERLREQRAKREANPEDIGEIDRNNLTASGTWSEELVQKATEDMANVADKEGAEWFVKHHGNAFIQEYYFPTKGELHGDGRAKQRIGTIDDWKLIYTKAQEMEELLLAVINVYGLEDKKERITSQFADIKAKSKRRTDPAVLEQEKAVRDGIQGGTNPDVFER